MSSAVQSTPKPKPFPLLEEAALPQASQRGRSAFRRRNDLAGYPGIAHWLVAFFGFTLIPILTSLSLAFTGYRLTAPPESSGVDNFERMFFHDPRYWKSGKAAFMCVFRAVPL